MLPQQIVYISIFTSMFAGYFYIRDTINGKTKPNLVSWFIWFLATTIAGTVSLVKGGGISALPILMAGFTPFAIILISFWKKNGYWKLGLLDYFCLTFALVAVLSWVLLKEGTIATICAILADLIAFIPTFVKSWKDPDSENIWPYCSGIFNPFLTLATISVFSFNTIGFAVYLFFGNLTEVLIVLVKRRLKNKIV